MAGISATDIFMLVIGVGIAVFIFLLIRSVILWYFKIDERLTALNKANKQREQILEQLRLLNGAQSDSEPSVIIDKAS